MDTKIYQPKNMKDSNENENIIKPDKITIPETYPDFRQRKTNISIPSDMNAEYAKEWVEFNKL